MKTVVSLTALALSMAVAAPAAAKVGDPVKISDDLTIDPIVEGRLRYEAVDQDDISLDADAVTMRLRAGFEAKSGGFSFLVEGEGTLAITNDYNAFPFAVASEQRRTGYSVVPDAENIDLNRIQVSYKVKGNGVTLGRQRINLDDQRWVGSVAWRQNEQTFDAVRGEAKIGPVSLDATYAWSQRTIFGYDAGPRQAYDGNFVFLGASTKVGPFAVKGFSYLIDYNDPIVAASSSQTYGARATGTIPVSKPIKIDLTGSYARQLDYKGTNDFNAEYIAGEAGISFGNLRVAGGYELLGSDNGRALQTPMATLHKFNGWADVFLTTPVNGLQDAYGSVGYKFGDLGPLKGLNAQVIYHQFDSDVGDIEYGTEWDAQLGFKFRQFSILAKYANYSAVALPTTGDVSKFWLQLEFAY